MTPLIIFLLISIPLCTSTPESLCDTLLPFHVSEQSIPDFAPFTIVASSATIEQNQTITVQIKSGLPELKFGGFMIQARNPNPPYNVIGRFTSLIDGLTLISCDGVDNTAIFLVSSSSADDLELMWEAPSDFSGEVLFKATIAQQNDKLWARVQSLPVHIVPVMALIPPKAAIPALTRIVAALAEDYVPVVETKQTSNSGHIYEGCGINKTCFGMPDNCMQQQSCQALVTAVRIDARFIFELQSTVNNTAYVSFALSRDNVMGDDSTVECIQEGGVIRAYTSWSTARPNLGSTRQGVPQNIINLMNTSFNNGMIYCKFERNTVSTKLGYVFDLANENFFFQLAMGYTITPTAVTWHDIGRISSMAPVEIIRQFNPIYEGCGTAKTCFGFPAGCVDQLTCTAVATAVYTNYGQFEFELESGISEINYIAFGLSTDTLMGNDSVVECVPEQGIVRAYASWNFQRTNDRIDIPQDIITLINSSYIDGKIYCKLQRQPYSTKLGKEFNLREENFHFLLAMGNTATANAIGVHTLGRIASAQPVNIIRPLNPIYDGCGETKTCFGLPVDCVEENDCQAIVTAVVHDDDHFEFELQSGVSNVAYVAFGLSTDTLMGDDSVIECLPEGATVQAYSSWNTRRGNTREDIPQDIITLTNSSYVNGVIYCKLDREPYVTKLGKEFNLNRRHFHFMLAIGTSASDVSIGYHNLGHLASEEPIELIEISAGRIATSISIVSIAAWFLATSFSNYLH